MQSKTLASIVMLSALLYGGCFNGTRQIYTPPASGLQPIVTRSDSYTPTQNNNNAIFSSTSEDVITQKAPDDADADADADDAGNARARLLGDDNRGRQAIIGCQLYNCMADAVKKDDEDIVARADQAEIVVEEPPAEEPPAEKSAEERPVKMQMANDQAVKIPAIQVPAIQLPAAEDDDEDAGDDKAEKEPAAKDDGDDAGDKAEKKPAAKDDEAKDDDEDIDNADIDEIMDDELMDAGTDTALLSPLFAPDSVICLAKCQQDNQLLFNYFYGKNVYRHAEKTLEYVWVSYRFGWQLINERFENNTTSLTLHVGTSLISAQKYPHGQHDTWFNSIGILHQQNQRYLGAVYNVSKNQVSRLQLYLRFDI